MTKRLFLYAFLCFLTSSAVLADERFSTAASQLETMQKNNEQSLLVSSRNMQLRLYPQATKCVAVILHGLFQSPKDMQGLINHFYNRGCNVVAPLLKGHWSKDPNAFYKINFQTWKTQVTEVLEWASQLGDKIILVGHSTGGLLALQNIIENTHYNFSHAVLFAPAIKLRKSVIRYSKLGKFLKAGYQPPDDSSTSVDEYSLQARPAIAGVHVQRLIENTFGKEPQTRSDAYRKIKIPLLLVSTENDAVVAHEEVVRLSQVNTNFFQLISYPKSSPLMHDNIQRSLIDVEPNSPKEWTNPHYNNLLKQIDSFINLQGRIYEN